MPTTTISWRSGSCATTGSSRARSAVADPARPERLVERPPRPSASSGRRSARPSRGDELADRQDATATTGPLPILPGGRPELAAAIVGVGRTVGRAPSSSAETPSTLPPLAAEVAAVIARPSARSSPRRSARSRGSRSSIGPRRCTASPATSAAGSTSTGSCPAWSTTPWSCSRPTAARSSCATRTATVTAPRSAAGLSAVVPLERPRLPGQLAPGRGGRPRDGRCSPWTTATTRAARASGPPSSRRASTPSAPRRSSTAPTLLGLLNVYHDEPHPWTDDDLETMAALATQASVAIRAAQDFERMATWAAQLQSIQQLGTRLSRLSAVQRDRHGHRHRAPPAHRLPQRPRLPARRRRARSRSR